MISNDLLFAAFAGLGIALVALLLRRFLNDLADRLAQWLRAPDSARAGARPKPRAQGEDHLQKEILDWLGRQRPDLFCCHIPNGGVTRFTVRRMLALGMRPGMPDLLLLNAAGDAGFLEVKTTRGRVQANQTAVLDELRARCRRAAVVRSLPDVEKTLQTWGWA